MGESIGNWSLVLEAGRWLIGLLTLLQKDRYSLSPSSRRPQHTMLSPSFDFVTQTLYKMLAALAQQRGGTCRGINPIFSLRNAVQQLVCCQKTFVSQPRMFVSVSFERF